MTIKYTAVAAALITASTSFTTIAAKKIDEEIIVTSSRVEVPLRQIGTSVSILTDQEINLRGYSSLPDLLRTQPGIGVSNSGGMGKQTSLRIRGEESYRTLIMIDGIEISDPTGTQVGPHLEHLLVSNDIERVEILRGAQGFIYGADAGGVVNIFTRQGKGDLSGQLDLETGSHNSQKFTGSLSAGNDQGDFFISATTLESDGFNTRADDSLLKDDDGYENTTLHTKLGWNATQKLRLQLVARNIDGESEFDGCGFPTTHDCNSDFEQTTAKVSIDYRGDKVSHFLAYANTDIERASFAAGYQSFTTEGDTDRLEYTGSYQLTRQVKAVYGLDWENEDIVSSSGNAMERDQKGYYLELQGEFKENLFITAGARHDDNDDFGEHSSARVSVAYLQELTNGSTIKYRASYGTGFRAPSLSEIAYNFGPYAFGMAANFALSEETSKGYDLGIEYFGANGLHLEAVYFDQQIEDEIYFDLITFSGYLQGNGDSESRGVELIAEFPIHQNWELFANFTYNDTEDTDGVQRSRRPEKQGNLGVSFTAFDQKFNLIANLRIARDAKNELFAVGFVNLDDYEVLDISASYAVSDNLEVFGRAENVTDEDYQEITNFNTDGSSVYAGVRLRF